MELCFFLEIFWERGHDFQSNLIIILALRKILFVVAYLGTNFCYSLFCNKADKNTSLLMPEITLFWSCKPTMQITKQIKEKKRVSKQCFPKRSVITEKKMFACIPFKANFHTCNMKPHLTHTNMHLRKQILL